MSCCFVLSSVRLSAPKTPICHTHSEARRVPGRRTRGRWRRPPATSWGPSERRKRGGEAAVSGTSLVATEPGIERFWTGRVALKPERCPYWTPNPEIFGLSRLCGSSTPLQQKIWKLCSYKRWLPNTTKQVPSKCSVPRDVVQSSDCS